MKREAAWESRLQLVVVENEKKKPVQLAAKNIEKKIKDKMNNTKKKERKWTGPSSIESVSDCESIKRIFRTFLAATGSYFQFDYCITTNFTL